MQSNVILDRCAEDVAFFAKLFLPEHIIGEVPEFHHELYECALEKGYKFKAIVAPRGHAKSTTMTLAFVLWNMLFRKKKFIVIISDSLPQSKLFLEAIADELEFNERIIKYFGETKSDQWATESITTTTGIRVVCKGAGQKVRGLKFINQRPDLIMCDDIENDEAVSTSEQRMKLKRWFNAAVIPARDKIKGELIIVGTILHFDSLLNNIYETDKRFRKHKFSAIKEDGKALWPAMWTLEDLEKERQHLISQGLGDVFSQEYLSIPLDPATQEFKQEMFRYYKTDDVKKINGRHVVQADTVTYPLNINFAVDPSMGQSKTSDFSAIIVIGESPTGFTYVLDLFRERVDPAILVSKLFDMVLKWSPLEVSIESNGFQLLIGRTINDEMRRRSVFFRVNEYKTSRNKEVRIRSLVPAFKSGTILLPDDGCAKELVEELITFPRGRHDDAADALEAAFDNRVKRSRRGRAGGAHRNYTPTSKIGGY